MSEANVQVTINGEMRPDWLELRKKRIAKKEEERLERFTYYHEAKRQRREVEKKKCPACHCHIAEKFIDSVYDVPLFSRDNGTDCRCTRDVFSQFRRFLLVCICFNTHTKIPMCQYPNGIISSGVRITTGEPSDTYAIRRDEATRSVFESMEDLEHTLAQQTIIHDWSIEWIDGK